MRGNDGAICLHRAVPHGRMLANSTVSTVSRTMVQYGYMVTWVRVRVRVRVRVWVRVRVRVRVRVKAFRSF